MQVGKKTELVQNIEKIIGQTRMDNLYTFSKDIDTQILYIIDDIVVEFFKANKGIISSVYKIKVQNKLNQYYLLVLEKDTIENRGRIFSFLDAYDTTEVSVKYPVMIKFTTEDTLSGFFIEKKIDI